MTDAALAIQIDVASTVPVYRQIVDAVRALLVGGHFTAGDQLPTVRELAADLGIHHNTVAEAYRLLEGEGWLVLGRRRGATIIERRVPKPTTEKRAWFSKRLRELVAEAQASGIPPDVIRNELSSLVKRY